MARTEKRIRVERGLYLAGKVYMACATAPGSRTARWKTIGEVGLMEARRERDLWAVEVRSGGILVADGRETVKEVADAWLKHIERLVEIGELRKRTLESYATGVRLHLEPTLGGRRIRSVTPEDLVEWYRAQRATGASDWSIRARWIAVRGVFGFAARHNIIPNSPADKLLPRERPGTGEPRQRFLSREEMDALLEHAGDAYGLIATGLFTGLRAMEILGLQWGDIDFKGGEIRARSQLSRQGKRVPLKTKAAKRDIVLMDALGALLKRRRLAERFSADNDFVFQSSIPQVPMTYRAFLIAFHDARDAAGLTDVTPHALRHTFASILIAQGHDVQFVSRQLGHTKVSTTWDTYIHLFEAQKHAQDARDKLQAEYGGMLGGSS
ncbi:MAG TPA: tyrosine-type recombinase/integrase [Solirubrobacteraceae bacterium]|jgi:integrase|nr:tyrosine-type recombinase/integrase [Solirubrobacteraceae bacterium]